MKRKLKINTIIIALFIIASIIITIYFFPIIKKFQTEEGITKFRNYISDKGVLSYLIVLGIQIIQIVIAFIPGQFIEMAAATIYSPIVALVILELGLVTATIIIYYLGKWIGKPFIELFLNGENETKFSFIFKSKKMKIVFFVLFLIPGTPKDVLIYFLPLVNISLLEFLLLSTLARLPGYLLDIYMVESFLKADYVIFIIVIGIIVISGILFYIYKDRIMNYLRSDKKRSNMKLLVVVDYQKDFVDGALGFKDANLLDERIARKIDLYHQNNDDVIFTFDTHYENYLQTEEGKNLPVKHCIKGTVGHELFGITKSKMTKKDRIIKKEIFGSKELGKILEKKFYNEIEFVGLVSNICVISNAVIARTFSKESVIIVDALCTDSFDKELNEKCFDVMEGLQIKVINRNK